MVELRKNFEKLSVYVEKYHKTFFVLVIAIGGANQFINLLMIGTGYLRFFSVTQLLSDGIPTSIWLFLLSFYSVILIGRFKYIDSKYDQKRVYWISYFWIVFGFLLFIDDILSAISFDLKPFGDGLKFIGQKFNAYSIFLRLLIIMILFYYIFPETLVFYKHTLNRKEFVKKDEKMSFIDFIKSFMGALLSAPLTMGLIFSMLILPTTLYYSSQNVLQEFLQPKNLRNKSDLISKIRKNLKIENVEIKYYNDNYVFLEVQDRILVLSIETLIPNSMANL